MLDDISSLDVQIVTLTKDARGLNIVPTRMVRLTIKHGGVSASIDVSPRSFLEFGHRASILVNDALEKDIPAFVGNQQNTASSFL